jgi:hypothetical protein
MTETREKKQRGIWILLAITMLIGGYVYNSYKANSCTNENASGWTLYQLYECDVYYKDPLSKGEAPNRETLDGWVRVVDAHVSSFDERNEGYATDKRYVYYRGERVVGAEPSSFVHFEGNYWKDSLRVYWRGVALPGSEPDDFLTIDEKGHFSRSGGNEYYQGALIRQVPESAASNIIIAPFDGQEVAPASDMVFFWGRGTSTTADTKEVALAIVGDAGSFQWITSGFVSDNGIYTWLDARASSTDEVYAPRIYRRYADGSVELISGKNYFTFVDEPAPGLVLKINGSADPVQYSEPEIVVTWASANVVSCEFSDGIPIELIGHTVTRFFVDPDAEATNLRYRVACNTADGNQVERTILLRSLTEEVGEAESTENKDVSVDE